MPTPDPALILPTRWRLVDAPDPAVLVSARAPMLPVSGVAPTVELRRVPVTGDLAGWRESELTGLAGQLRFFELEDQDRYELGGHDVAYCRFAHLPVGVDLVCEQWAWLVDGVGFVLTGTVARQEYADLCEVFEAVAAGFDPVTGVHRASA